MLTHAHTQEAFQAPAEVPGPGGDSTKPAASAPFASNGGWSAPLLSLGLPHLLSPAGTSAPAGTRVRTQATWFGGPKSSWELDA